MRIPGCPQCGLLTLRSRLGEVVAFKCEACGGHTVDAAALHAFLDRHVGVRAFEKLMQRARDAAPSVRALTCPDCQTNSYHGVRSGLVELDVCSTCVGIYLDKGEARLYFEQVKVQPTATKVADRTLDAVDTADAGLDVAGAALKLFGRIFD